MEITPAQIDHLRRRIQERMTVEHRGYSTPCWVSNRAKHRNGYTKIYHGGKFWLTHRLAYTVFRGAIPEDLVIDHLCRVRACVNPDHLEAVTQQVNILRGTGISAREVLRTHCPQGHPYSGDNLAVYGGSRVCRTCMRARNRAWHRRSARARSTQRDMVSESSGFDPNVDHAQ